MGRLKAGFYFEIVDVDDEKPEDVVRAKRIINEIQESVARKARQIKRDELAEYGTNMALAKGEAMAVLSAGRSDTKMRIAKKVAQETVDTVTQTNGDLIQAASILGVGKECIRQRLVSYVDRGWVERVGPKEWRVLPECLNGEGE